MFTNSLNTEMSTGGTMEGKPPMEVGASKNEMDYVHVINWKKLEELVKANRAPMVGTIRQLSMETAVAEGALFFIPVSKSPHGVDVTPDGKFIVCAGKLDPHATVYSFEKIQAAIASKNFEGKDRYGIPILKYDAVREAYVELGLGPLHTEYDDKGYCYTSLFLDSAVAKWALPGNKDGKEPWKLLEKLSVQYNIGHLTAAGGDSATPYGKYLLALNKWSIDRHPVVGPLHPQNLQLIDISGEKMKVIYELPIGLAEPHASNICPISLIKAWTTYPEVGFDPKTMKKDPYGINIGQERVVREDGPGLHDPGPQPVPTGHPPVQAGRPRDPAHHERRARARRHARPGPARPQRQPLDRSRPDRDGRVRRQTPRRLPVVLHGVLLRAPHGDDRLDARGTPRGEVRQGDGEVGGSERALGAHGAPGARRKEAPT